MMGDTARESEDGDQALGSVQGTSQKVHNPTLMVLIPKKQELHTLLVKMMVLTVSITLVLLIHLKKLVNQILMRKRITKLLNQSLIKM